MGAQAARQPEHHPHQWATLQDDNPYGVHSPVSEGAPSWPAASSSAASAARPNLQLDHAAAVVPRPARGRPGTNVPRVQRPLAELVRQHSLPEVDPDRLADERVTTMVILNIPYAYPNVVLQRDILQEGLAHDYFQCPQETRTGRNRGFAIINFVTPEAANAFQRSFNNRELFFPGAGTKRVTVLPSNLQGLEANARRNPGGLVLDPEMQLQQHQQQPRHQQQALAAGSSSSRGPQAAAPAAMGHSAASSSSQAAPMPLHPPSSSGNAPVFYRFSF